MNAELTLEKPMKGIWQREEAHKQQIVLRLADEIWVGFKIFKILYRFNYSGIYFLYYHCNVTTVL